MFLTLIIIFYIYGLFYSEFIFGKIDTGIQNKPSKFF